MNYLFGVFGFCLGFYAGLQMLKPAMRRYTNEELRNNKGLAFKVGWVPWVMAFIGMWLAMYCFEMVMSDEYFTKPVSAQEE